MARFTPVTTAISLRSCARRMAPVRQEPPGRSTNNTEGTPPMAASMRAASARGSQPSWLTATSALSTPLIARTAVTSAAASSACETTAPRNSLIVLFEILPQRGPLVHLTDQTVVEVLCRVHAAVAQQVAHGHDLADHREILSRVERYRHQRHGDAEDGGLLRIEAGPVVFACGIPVLELYHDLDPLLLPHRPDAEQLLDVDQSDAADLHVMARHLVATTDQDVHPAARDVYHVICHQSVAPLHQVAHALALADPGAAHEQPPDAVHVRERAVQRRRGGEHIVQVRLQAAVELRRLERGADDRHLPGARQLEQLGRRLLRLGDHDARQVELEEELQGAAPLGGLERAEVADLRFAQNVDAVTHEARRIPREHEPRTRRLRRRDLAIESLLAGERL